MYRIYVRCLTRKISRQKEEKKERTKENKKHIYIYISMVMVTRQTERGFGYFFVFYANFLKCFW